VGSFEIPFWRQSYTYIGTVRQSGASGWYFSQHCSVHELTS
jgi:hypothetical protein